MAKNLVCSVEGCCKPIHRSGICSMHHYRMKRHGTFEKMKTANGDPPAFFEAMMKVDVEGCIIWPYSKNKAGYGKICNQLVHRLACIEEHGPPPTPKHEAAHKPSCHTPSCFNRKHLYWATCSENQMDRVINGTSNRGGRYRNSKLKEDDVRRIRTLIEAGMTHDAIAAQYQIARTAITRIGNRTRWGWVE